MVMVQSQLSRLLKYSVRFSRFYAELTVNCTKVTLVQAEIAVGVESEQAVNDAPVFEDNIRVVIAG